MPLQTKFIDYTIDDITRVKEEKLADGWRAVQILCTNCDDGLEIVYTYTKGDVMENYIVHGVTKDDVIPSISDAFIGMFVFENEAHDLFGANIQGIAIDFGGKFYDLAMPEPMTVISAEKQAAKEKAAKVAAAKAAAEAKRAAATDAAKDEKPSIEEQRAAFEAKIANLDPEKAAKMRAAFEAKLAKLAKEGE
ncbi:MAG: NADH-quinone oxidoreductase subunit C [Coriobacteriia bacterium]|nr:NADH-quinone oxidoreductase subunit C [Coriobacteriia bacterium]